MKISQDMPVSEAWFHQAVSFSGFIGLRLASDKVKGLEMSFTPAGLVFTFLDKKTGERSVPHLIPAPAIQMVKLVSLGGDVATMAHAAPLEETKRKPGRPKATDAST